MKGAQIDVLLSIAGSAFTGSIPSGIPTVYASDATFRIADGYHPHYRNVGPRSRLVAERLERTSIERADCLTYPSAWAAESAIRDYGADPRKVHCIPWGANLSEFPVASTNVWTGGTFRLLLVGGNWHFKGADIAVETVKILRNQGYDVHLTICGCMPLKPETHDAVRIVPFLNKNNPSERLLLEKLYQTADLFILPTRSDCFGIVFCEAAAYGLPSLAPATGGVPSAVKDGVNGILVPDGSGGHVYAAAIRALLADRERLADLRRRARLRFETELNWEVWASALTRRIEAL